MKPTQGILLLASLFFSIACDRTAPEVSGNRGDSGSEPQPVSRHEALANSVLETLSDAVTIVANISDIDSAKAAARDIDGLGIRLSKIREEFSTLDPLPREALEEIAPRLNARDSRIRERTVGELGPILESLDPEANEIVTAAFDDFFKEFAKVGKEFERLFAVSDGPISQVNNIGD